MTELDFFSSNESKLLDWLINFSKSLPQEGALLGITPAEISSLNGLISSVIEDIKNDRSGEKKEQKESMFSFLILMINRMKQHPAYQVNEQGKKLGIDKIE